MEEYAKARKEGRRRVSRAVSRGEFPYPPALDDLIGPSGLGGKVALGVMEIPLGLVVGTRTRGRQNLFSQGFYPLGDEGSEFAAKWEALYRSQVSEGMREPIVVFEYQQRFYVQEGNKRVSVARVLGMPTIAAQVTRVIPSGTETPEAMVYQEFLRFWGVCPMYGLTFSRPGSYERLARALGQTLGEPWDEAFVRRVKAAYQRFCSVAEGRHLVGGAEAADAFLAYVQAYAHDDPLGVGERELARRMSAMHDDLVVAGQPDPIAYASETPRPSGMATSLMSAAKALSTRPSTLVAFIYDKDPGESGWTALHEAGRAHLEESMPHVRTRAFASCADEEGFQDAVNSALAAGADLVVSTSPRQFEQTVRAAHAHPKARFVNCSINLPSASVRTFYARMYEVKFVMGALAASLAENHRMGYLAVSPIYGAVSEVNAFALGAALVDPYATVRLGWNSANLDAWREALGNDEVSMVCGMDWPDPTGRSGPSGLYSVQPDGSKQAVAQPVWDWGRYYELIVRSLEDGSWGKDARATRDRARNYWLGMRSGVVRLETAEGLPEGQRKLVALITRGMVEGTLSPFGEVLFDQRGSIELGEGQPPLSDERLATMSWLAPNVIGRLPRKSELSQAGRVAVEASGVLPAEEG